MNHRLTVYLDQVMTYANLPPGEDDKVRQELLDHLLERVDELRRSGATQDDAVFRAVHDHGRPSIVGYGLRPAFPWIDVRMRGTARGVIAVGPRAVGILSFGFVSTGVVSFGILSLGVFGVGAFALGLILGLGGIGIGGLALGFTAVGAIAAGFVSAGILSAGTYTAGMWVFRGAHSLSYFDHHTVPGWLQQLGFTLGFNASELAISILPLLVLFSAFLVTATAFILRERRRLGHLNEWAVQ